MTDSNGSSNNNRRHSSKPPSHAAYLVTRDGSGKSYTHFDCCVGAAWAHNDGSGFFIRAKEGLALPREFTVRPVEQKSQ